MEDNYRVTDFLGRKRNQYVFDEFKISIVDYTERVSEEWHFHEKMHLSTILKGGNLESRKKEDLQVTPGSVLIYKEGEIHRNRFTSHPSKNFNVEFERTFFKPQIELSNFKVDESGQNTLLKLYFELLLDDQFTKDAVEHQLRALFWNDNHHKNGHWLEQVKILLNDRWNEYPTLEELSNELKVHPVTICKYFSKRYGLTISEYLRKVKVNRAINMLLNSNRSLAEIAFACGFTDQSHMNRLIKMYIGYTPSRLRKAS